VSSDAFSDWPFDQAPNVAAITTDNVLERGAAILVVVHYYDDDSWAFLCGLMNDVAAGRVIGMGEALRRDPTLRDIADLKPVSGRSNFVSREHV